jgi:hypothetical protein
MRKVKFLALVVNFWALVGGMLKILQP